MAEKEIRKLAAVMFTDIEGYTAMVQRHESDALAKVAIHRRYLEQFTEAFNGRVIQFYGDGSLSIYESAVDAVRCAMAMQRAYRSDGYIPVRIGIHVGDVVLRDNSVFGDGVNISSRLQASGIAGGILISERVKAELDNHPDIMTKWLGRKKLKNVSSPVGVYAVSHESLAVPRRKSAIRAPGTKKLLWLLLPALMAGGIWWFLAGRAGSFSAGNMLTEETISVPLFANHTGDPSKDHIAQMASHWITKELGATPNARVVSYEAASETVKLAGISLASSHGRARYEALTGAANIVEANFATIGPNADSLMMSGFIKNLRTGKIIQSLNDVKCAAANPMECIQAMSGNVRGYWASRKDNVLTPPNYEAYKAFLAAKNAWRGDDPDFVFGQLQRAISLDPAFIDPYFLMLDFFYNEGLHRAAYDTIGSMRKKFTDLDARQANLLSYHAADIEGKKEEAYRLFLHEYKRDPKDLFINNSAMVMAIEYRNNPEEALEFFRAIPNDSLHFAGCAYCLERLVLAMRAALDAKQKALASKLEPLIAGVANSRQSYGILIMYHVYQKDTAAVDRLLARAATNPDIRSAYYLPFLAGRLFLLQKDSTLAQRYAEKAIEATLEEKGRALARSYYLAGRLDKALATYLEALENGVKDARIYAEMGMIYARQGRAADAAGMIALLEEHRQPFDLGHTEYYQARIHALSGDIEKAISLLELSLSKGQRFELWTTFSHDPDIMALSHHPGFKQWRMEN